jgi:hypothetical protein
MEEMTGALYIQGTCNIGTVKLFCKSRVLSARLYARKNALGDYAPGDLVDVVVGQGMDDASFQSIYMAAPQHQEGT